MLHIMERFPTQVLWLGKPEVQITCEPASSLPTTVIEEFEKGLTMETCQHSTHHYGHETSTILFVEKEELQQPKKPRRARPYIPESTG